MLKILAHSDIRGAGLQSRSLDYSHWSNMAAAGKKSVLFVCLGKSRYLTLTKLNCSSRI